MVPLQDVLGVSACPGESDTYDVCAIKYRRWLMLPQQAWLRERLCELRGARLICECPPGVPCHGDVLAALAAIAGPRQPSVGGQPGQCVRVQPGHPGEREGRVALRRDDARFVDEIRGHWPRPAACALPMAAGDLPGSFQVPFPTRMGGL